MTINNLRFADDIVLLADSIEDLQTLVTNIHTVSRKFGLTINKGKTEVQMIAKESKPMSVYIDEVKLKQVETFTYLGGIISENSTCTDDIKRRIGLAMGGMQKLTSIWKSRRNHNRNQNRTVSGADSIYSYIRLRTLDTQEER